MLSIAKDDKIFLGGTQVKWKELEAKLKSNERVQKESALYIEADTALLYGRVVTAMAIAKNAGVTPGDDAHGPHRYPQSGRASTRTPARSAV